MIVGLTGGIGSGKTTVLNFFKDLGVSCYVTDIEAKRLMNTSLEIKKDLIILFGDDAYTSQGLNRKFIADIVFKIPKKLEELNAIVHPRVFDDFKMFVENSKADYIIYESAILLQGDFKNLCDKIIVITAPLKTRIERVVQRDKVLEQDVLARINQQMSEKEMMKKADFIINNISLESTKNEVDSVNRLLLKEIKSINI
ncbi:MAG: dephospho-CoA kinase [Flavobacteriaceae bacterium]|nr:MAG: dephospho-CoA kinase [Flavobacteriaceae bacterium]